MAKKWFCVVVVYYANVMVEADDMDQAQELAQEHTRVENLQFDTTEPVGQIPEQDLGKRRSEAQQIIGETCANDDSGANRKAAVETAVNNIHPTQS